MNEEEIFIKGPLFNRLKRPRPGMGSGRKAEKWISFDQLCQFITAEMTILLNSRSNPPRSINLPGGSRMSYGGPNLTDYYGDSHESKKNLVLVIENLIKTFEPRLRDISVSFSNRDNKSLNIIVKASLYHRRMNRPVSFEIPVN